MFNLLKFVFSPHQWVELFTLYGSSKDGGDAPDFTALAAAAEKAAELGYELGQDQLDENKRQYDQNMAVTRPVVEAQLGLMGQTKEQGDDYFNYMKQFSRPAETSLFYEAMGFTPDEIEQIETSRANETAASKAAFAQQQASLPKTMSTSIDIPTFTKQMETEGIVKGSDLKGVIRLANTNANSDARLLNYGRNANGGIAGSFGEVDLYGRTQADPNLFYKKEKDGTYSIVEPKETFVEGKKTITFDIPTGLGNDRQSVIQTPETDALTNKLAALASARMKAQSQAERDAIDAQSRVLEQRLGETNTQVYERYKNDIEAEAGAAVADSRAGYTNSLNTAARQGIRYGFSPAKLAAMASQQGIAQGAMQAAAANQTRKAATETMYGRGVAEASQGLTRVNANRSMRQQDDSLQFAKKLDLAGIYRGLPGASQGAYQASISAGNSAVGNQNATSAQYLQGMNAGTNTIMAGQQAKINGLSNVAQMQTGIYNTQAGQNDAIWGALGTVGGAAMAKWSDKTIKKDIKKIDDDKALEGVKKTEISSWKYDREKAPDDERIDDKKHIGAMAQDLKKNLGSQVSDGRMVDVISAIGVNMAATKALAKKVDKLEGKRK